MKPVPEPVVVKDPGFRVNVQVPVAGRLLKINIPVDLMHVGCAMESMTGGRGVSGCTLIRTLDDDKEVHPIELVTVKV